MAIILFFACTNEKESEIENQFLENFGYNKVNYPMSSSLEGLDTLRWGLFPEKEQLYIRSKSEKITLKAIALSSKILNKGTDMADNKAKFIKEAKEFFFEFDETTPHVLLAKQMVAMNIQTKTFDGFIYQDDIINSFSSYSLDYIDMELLEYGTSLLAETGNPNADMMFLNLLVLSDFIDQNDMNQYARKAVENAKRWYQLADSDNCVHCSQKKNSTQTKKETINYSILQLQEMIN
jgi:hypothetical protein